IRAQCALARFYEDDPFDGGILDRHLAPRQREAWLAPLAALGLRPPDGEEHWLPMFTFRRGFVESLQVAAGTLLRQFVACAPEVFRLPPLLHLRITFDDTPPPWLENLTALVSLPQAGRLRTLDFPYTRLLDDDAKILLTSPHLTPRTQIRF